MAKMSPTQLTLRRLRRLGAVPEVVERWNPHARKRHDLFGIIDVLALCCGTTLGVQTTSLSNVSARRKKILTADVLPAILACGWRIEVEGWYKSGRKWESRRWVLTQDCEFEEVKE